MSLEELSAQAFEIVVHGVRWADGAFRVFAIEEIIGCTETTFDTHPQFRAGAFAATVTVPRFYAELEARGIPDDQAVLH